ncbi:MAG: 3-hydroxyacyl-ACP dehydratase FabZ [Methylotenera sp.]|nr:3-hydroxyacyl-ACP dehydratase FabZ [Oligoflexia bacterium]
MEQKPQPNPYLLNIDQIRRFLPHRSPFLLIDRILEIHPQGNLDDMTANDVKVGVKVVALKNISFNEPCFQGHFPEYSIFPGVLIIEAMAQAASFSLYPYLVKDLEAMARDFQCILVGVDGARFRKPVVPGDTLIIESVVSKCRGKLWFFDVVGKVDGQKVAEAQLMANLMVKGNN